MYLEGSDQHRGWFQSSLLVGLGTRGRPPFRAGAHARLPDRRRRPKMSKSLGNTILPQDVIKESGADILRLWVAMSDYREEMRVGKEILARVVEAYRKIRNTLRYLLGEPLRLRSGGRSRAARRSCEEVDRYILARYADDGADASCAATSDYDYPARSSRRSTQFATVDLSAFYADVSKDRLYTFAAAVARAALGADGDVPDGRRPDAAARADPVVHRRRAVAATCPGAREESVHLALFPAGDELDALVDADARSTRWDAADRACASEVLARDRAAAQGQADRQLAAGARSSCRPAASELALLERVRERAADAVHRVGGRRSSAGGQRRASSVDGRRAPAA